MQYVIAGTGGQGVLLVTRILGAAAMARGEHITGSEVHGMAQRGGSVHSHLKVGDFSSPVIGPGRADLLLALDQREAVRNLRFLRRGGTLVVNVDDEAAFENGHLKDLFEEMDISVHRIRGYEILEQEMSGRTILLNTLVLGAMCAAGAGGESLDNVEKALTGLVPPKHREANMKAFRLGAEAMAAV